MHEGTVAYRVWTDPHGFGRNRFAIFRREFDLDELPGQAVLHLHADTRYRLRVNGEIVAYGPIRFFPHAPQHDSIDLLPSLRVGANVVTVEVNSFGANNFESVPSIAGFLAWSTWQPSLGSDPFATPGEWRCRPATAWSEWAPPHSFAQGPVEILDLAALPEAWFLPGGDVEGWERPTRLIRQDNWGRSTPRSIGPYDHRLLTPTSIKAAPLKDDELRAGFCVRDLCERRNGRAPRIPYAVYLHSPSAQSVELGLFWGPNWLNGELLKTVDHPSLAGKQIVSVHLQEGWNLLYGEPEGLVECWSFLVGIAKSTGVQFRAERDLACPHALRYAMPTHAGLAHLGQIPPPTLASPLPEPKGGWMWTGVGELPEAPAKLAAWDSPAAAWTDLPPELPPGEHVIVADMGCEFIGHVRFRADAPAGATFDVSVEEVMRPDGMSPIFRHVFSFVGDRYRIPPDGLPSEVEAFRTRGGRFVQIIVRNPNGPVRIGEIGVRQTLASPPREGSFSCGDEVLDWGWEAGAHTIEANGEDAYVDPWRERGLYVGDLLIQHRAARHLALDNRLSRRSIELFGQSQDPNGVIRGCAPAWLDNPHLDYSFIWVWLLHEYWAWTGDAAFVREWLPAVAGVLEVPHVRRAESRLLDCTGHHVFGDWAIPAEARVGESAVGNLFYLRALESGAALAELLGERGFATRWTAQAQAQRAALHSLWNEAEGLYAATRMDGELWPGRATHANVLALLFNLAQDHPDREERVLRRVRDDLRENHLAPQDGIELYFLSFALDALAARGLYADCEHLVREHCRVMKDAGAWALWECLSRGNHGTGSQCHGWAAFPTVYLTQQALGVRIDTLGDPTNLLIAPSGETIDRASGTFPTVHGPMKVEWEIEGGNLIVRHAAPPGISVRVRPCGRLAGLALRVEGRA